mgnify:CR=1 FL=1
MKLDIIVGNLRDAYKQAVPGTLLHVDELMRERITNLELRGLWFFTPDGAVGFYGRKDSYFTNY